MRGTRLEAVEVATEPAQPAAARGQAAFVNLVALSFKALSQRAIVAVASLVDLALIGSAFILWLHVIEQPSVLQLVGIGMYAAFILVAILARRR